MTDLELHRNLGLSQTFEESENGAFIGRGTFFLSECDVLALQM
jgi:hypothetical protein